MRMAALLCVSAIVMIMGAGVAACSSETASDSAPTDSADNAVTTPVRVPDLSYSYSEPDLSRDSRNQELLEIHMLFMNGARNDIMSFGGKYTVQWPRVAEFEIELRGASAPECSASVVYQLESNQEPIVVSPGELRLFQAADRTLVWIQGGCDEAIVRAWESDQALPEPSA